MIRYHADVVLGGSNAEEAPCEETSLIDSSKALVEAFDALALAVSVEHVLSHHHERVRARLAHLDCRFQLLEIQRRV